MNVNGLPDTSAPSPFVYVNLAANSGVKASSGIGTNQENGVTIRQQNIKIDDAITIQRLPVEYQRNAQQVNTVNNSQQQLASNITIKKLTSQQTMPSALMCSVAGTDESHIKKNVSSLMVSNSMLNKLLDSRPHIPAFITKAADLAHILPNPLPRQQQAGNQLGDGHVSYTQPAPTMISTASQFTASDSFVSSSSMASVGDFRIGSSTTSEDRVLKVLPQIIDHTPLLSDVQMHHSRPGRGQVQVVNVQSQPCLKVVERKSVPSAGQTVEQFTKGLVEHQRKFPSSVGVDLLNTSQVSFPSVESQNLMSVSGRTQNKKSDNDSLSVSNNLPSDARTFSALLQNGDLENKSSPSIEMRLKPVVLQNSVAHSNNKTDLMTSSDPMFPSVAITSDVVLTTTNSFAPCNKTVITSSDLSVSNPSPNESFKTQHLTLSDLLSRGPSAETLLSASSGTPLTSLSDSKLHSSDVLLSELHRSDEGDLSLGASLQATAVVDTDGLQAAPESAHTGASDQIVVSESSLSSGITGDSSTLPGLSSLPLTGFSSLANLPPIPTDFMTAPSAANKTSPPSQGHLPALLSNLSTTTDLALSFSSNFLDNSNMSMDMSNLSESDMSLNVSGSVFGETHDKTSVTTSLSSKKITNSSSDLTFTNALKGVTSKIDFPHGLVSSVESVSRSKVEEVRRPVEDSVKASHQTRVPLFQSEPTKLDENIVPCCTVTKGKPSRKQMEAMQAKSKAISQSSRKRKTTQDKKLEVHKKSKLLLQQVPCFKCPLCPFLIQEEEAIVQHMKEEHMEYFLQTNEEEESEDECEEEEEGSVLSGKRLKGYLTDKVSGDPLDCQKDVSDDKKIFREKRPNFELCDSTEINGKSATKAPKVPRHIFKVEREMEDYEAEEYRYLSHSEEVSSEMKKVEPDLVHNFQNGLTGSISENKNEYSRQTESEFGDESERRGKSKVDEVSIKGKNGKVTRDRKAKTTLLGIRCDVNGCGLKLKQEENIEYHRKCHIGALLVCPECHTKFGHWHSLAMHLWRAHIIDMELHKCDECDYKTYSLSKLHNTHKMIHGSERPFLCDMCGKGFKTAKQMRKHKSVHSEKSGIAHYTCNICQRQFSDKRMLRCHKDTVHDKVKRYLCNYCGYSASSNSTLKMHIRQHTGEKPFECDSCDYRTADHNSLRRHKMRHSGEKPYKCPYCTYASIQSSTYKTHIKNKHPNMAQAGGVMFMCPMCSYKTVKHDNYLAHVAEHKKKNEADKSAIATEVLVEKQDETQITTEVTSAPHIFNIDVNSGAVTVENPEEQHFLDPLDFQNHLTGQLIMAGGEQYVYAAVDSSLLQVLPETGITFSSTEFAKSLRTNAFLAIPAKLEPDIIVSDSVQTESKPKTFEHQTVVKLSACEGGGGGGGALVDEEEGKGFASKGCKH